MRFKYLLIAMIAVLSLFCLALYLLNGWGGDEWKNPPSFTLTEILRHPDYFDGTKLIIKEAVVLYMEVQRKDLMVVVTTLPLPYDSTHFASFALNNLIIARLRDRNYGRGYIKESRGSIEISVGTEEPLEVGDIIEILGEIRSIRLSDGSKVYYINALSAKPYGGTLAAEPFFRELRLLAEKMQREMR